MNKDRLFQSLSEEDATTLLELLRNAYDLLSHDDRNTLFGQYVEEMPLVQVDGETLLAESFFSSLKTECSQDVVYPTCEAVKANLFDYIEVFYNRQRLHSSLGYLSPTEFEQCQ